MGTGPFELLLVEDDVNTRSALTTHLRRGGFDVLATGSAEEALEHWNRGRRFDVIVSDVHLPGQSGIELAGRLLSEVPRLPIVLITGDPDEALAREALSRGPVSYLLKPFQLFELEAAVRQALAAQIARTGAPPRETVEPLIGTIPAEWVHWVDERSYAGAGHGDRVARLCGVIMGGLATPADLPLWRLEVAAYTHEIGIMSLVSSDPVELAWRGADLLADLGSDPVVVNIVRHMHEWWDGSGGPDQLQENEIPLGSQILAAADALDHYVAAWLQTNRDPAAAVERAVGLLKAQQGTVFNPEIVGVLGRESSSVHAICAIERAVPIAAEQPVPDQAKIRISQLEFST